jgi:hypothetical protein
MQIPKGTEIEARTGYGTEDGWEVEYSVTETVPPPPTKGDDGRRGLPLIPGPVHGQFDDFRDQTLRIDPASVEVHQVEWVTYKSNSFKVDRHRHEKRDLKF